MVMFVDGCERPELLKDLIRDAPAVVLLSCRGAQPPTVRVFALRSSFLRVGRRDSPAQHPGATVPSLSADLQRHGSRREPCR